MKKYIIFGTGSIAEKYYNQIKTTYGSDSIEFFLDSLLSKSIFCEKKVMHPEYLESIDANNYTYILGSVGSTISMKKELLSRGINEDNILEFRSTDEENMFKDVSNISHLLLYPEIPDLKTLKKFEYLITRDIPLYKDADLKFHVLATENTIIDSMNFIHTFVKDSEIILTKYDIVLVWDYEKLNAEVLRGHKHVCCIDPSFYFNMDRKVFLRLNHKIGLQLYHDYYKSISINNLNKLITQNLSKAYVFGNGPSLKEGIIRYQEMEMNKNEKAFTIVCNAFVMGGTEVIEKLHPDIYALIDMLFLTEEYDHIVQKIVDLVLETNCILLVPDYWMAYLCKRFQSIDKYLIGLAFDAPNITFPNENNLNICYKAGNVVTAVAIPIASAIADHIYISGCDGINLEDSINTTWKHSDLANHNIKVNPKDYDMVDSFLKHNHFFDEIIKYGESLGKKYHSITSSYIPALKEHAGILE